MMKDDKNDYTLEENGKKNLQENSCDTIKIDIASKENSTQVFPQTSIEKDCGCGSMNNSLAIPKLKPSFIYAVGRVDIRFPNPSIEKELAQVIGRGETKELTDRQAIHSVLRKRENRYLARQVCWVMNIAGLETYILTPRDPADFDLLLESIRPQPRATDVDIVIGVKGPIATPEVCNGLLVPFVVIDQMYSFDFDSLIKKIPKPEKVLDKQFTAASEELLSRIIQMTDNSGGTNEHRALNYLAVRYDAIYSKTSEMFSRNFSLTGIEVHPSSLSTTRRIVDVIFSYTDRNTDFTEKYFVRVDVTEQFPFLVTKLSPYYNL